MREEARGVSGAIARSLSRARGPAATMTSTSRSTTRAVFAARRLPLLAATAAAAAIVLLLAATPARASEGDAGGSSRPPVNLLGVHPSLLASYRASDRFSCDDGRVVLDPSKINDEYCDCADGMDEPGTSACANGRFHCRNRGGEPKDLPSSRVNDGVCDCCDGSDEVGRVGGVRCEKTCAAAGRKRRAELLERLKLAKGGVAKRRAAIAAAPAARAKWSAEVARLQNERDAKKIAADASEKLKDDADERAKALEKEEEEEKAAAAADEEEEKKRAEEAEASAAKEGAEDDTAGAAAAERSEQSEQSEDLAKLSRDLDELEAMIDDIGDGAAAPAPAPEHEETDEERGERMMRQWVKDDAPEKKDDDVVEDDAARDLEDPTPYLPEDVDADAYDDVNESEPEPEPESGGLLGKASKMFKGWGARRRRSAKKTRGGNASSDADASPSAATEARAEANRLRDAWSADATALRETEDALRENEARLTRFMGEDDEYAYMVGECYEAKVDKYVYEACPFGKASQDSTSLGTMQDIDRASPRTFKFTGGEGCWNGPARSLTATARCGAENKLAEVIETSRCEYVATLVTPAACAEDEERAAREELDALEREMRAAEEGGHDEL